MDESHRIALGVILMILGVLPVSNVGFQVG
jgi:hypothetical protein